MAGSFLMRTCHFNNKTKSRFKNFRDISKLKFSYKIQKFFCTATSFDNDIESQRIESIFQEGPSNQKESRMEALLSNGSSLVFESGKLAKLADGSATVTLQGTTVMATAVSKNKCSTSSFVPLIVSYQQKAAALGRIPLNFIRREHGQSENEILTSRLIDRSIRPLFPKNFNYDTQVFCSPLSLDGSNFPDTLCINAASAALAISDIPWNGPVAAVRLGLINNNIIINPTKKELSESSVNLVVTGRLSKYVIMLEGSFSKVVINDVKKLIKAGLKECNTICSAIQQLAKQCGKEKRKFKEEDTQQLYQNIMFLSREKLEKILSNHEFDKVSRDEAIASLQSLVFEEMREVDYTLFTKTFIKVVKDIMYELIFKTNIRCDGRSLSMLRHVNCKVDLYESLHGSALFQRGQTQVFCTVALDSPNSALKMDNISMLTSGVKEKNFFVHYEFPPFATNELGRVGPIGRREIGHGALAEKALKSTIPTNYPFTIRLTSEVLESNGSSSMATVCGGSLALMDAGIPVTDPCAGVAMGLVTKLSENDVEVEDYRILTDLMGFEDFFGDMDFKVASTKKGFTALQLDVKLPGIPHTIIMLSIEKAKEAISEILKKMIAVCPGPRTNQKKNCPILKKVNLPPHLRGKFIGCGGVNLKKLEMDTGVQLMEETPGEFTLFAFNSDALKEAEEKISEFLQEHTEPKLEFGGVYAASIVEIRDNGCLVILHPAMDPVLLPLNQLDVRKVAHPSALGLVAGQEIQVKYFGRDPVSGVMRLSRKVLQAPTSERVQSFFVKKSENETSEQSEKNSG